MASRGILRFVGKTSLVLLFRWPRQLPCCQETYRRTSFQIILVWIPHFSRIRVVLRPLMIWAWSSSIIWASSLKWKGGGVGEGRLKEAIHIETEVDSKCCILRAGNNLQAKWSRCSWSCNMKMPQSLEKAKNRHFPEGQKCCKKKVVEIK